MMTRFFEKYPRSRYLLNKYSITLLVFGVWIIFLDSNNLISQHRLRKNLNDLKADKIYYEKAIHENREFIRKLSFDYEYLEKLGREKYLMKRDNEDIFLFIK